MGPFSINLCECRSCSGARCLSKRQKEYNISVSSSLCDVIVIWATLLIRTPGLEPQAKLVPLWSWYRGFILNNVGVRNQIYANIVLFIPFGFFSYSCKARPLRFILLRGFLLSLLIEICQYCFCLGLFEWDDMLHNSLGCLIGAACGKIVNAVGSLQQWHNRRGRN